MKSASELWARYQQYFYNDEKAGVSVDISRMNFADDYFANMESAIQKAFVNMDALERGEIVNPDEQRMVGHYWLRNAKKAPTAAIKKAINDCLDQIEKFAKAVHTGKIKPKKAKLFKNVLIVGIGGSALGPQFVSRALGTAADKMKPYFFDNTDPDGMDATIAAIGDGLKETLVIVTSKSGGTKETRNGMLEAKAAYEKAGLKFETHAVAITQDGSELDKYAVANGWLERFPMWDWVGGRTSEFSAVGLLPAALQGIKIRKILEGAAQMDALTSVKSATKNPAAMLALMWYYAGDGKGKKDMVVLPYKDRLELFSKYLQQLVMESLGKEKDLDGNVVNQGIAVYGNKGSTDQHAYVQQLRDGVNNFFVTFIEVLEDRAGKPLMVEPDVTSGDYLSGFFQGTRRALHESGRENVTVTVKVNGPETVGKLVALYERTVGYYASLVNINAYHQPGVEAGKKAATEVLKVQAAVLACLKANKKAKGGLTAAQIAEKSGRADDTETVFMVLRHLAANKRVKRTPGATLFDDKYSK